VSRPNSTRHQTSTRDQTAIPFMSNVDLCHMQQSLTSLSIDRYVPGTIAWCDGDRGVNPDGSLNVFGTNNVDCKLKGKDGRVYPYLKSQNYNEHLGVTTADRVTLGVENGKEVTAQEVLETIVERAKKSGFHDVDVNVQSEHPVVVRFMNSFVPFAADQKTEFVVPTHYCYQTFSKDDPRNLLVSGHKGGIDVQADSIGDNPLYSLEYKKDNIDTHYYTVEATEHAVGTAQTTSDGTDQPPEVGIKGMGSRGNAFCVMSIPNKQKGGGRGMSSWSSFEEGAPVYRSLANIGEACAADLGVDNESMGEYDAGNAKIEYDPNEAIVITVLYYNIIRNVSGKNEAVAVAPKDIAMAAGDMDKAYNLCNAQGKLSELSAMLVTMTKEAMDVVKEKIAKDPPVTCPPPAKKFAFEKDAAKAFAKPVGVN
jgi:hypothetical protein